MRNSSGSRPGASSPTASSYVRRRSGPPLLATPPGLVVASGRWCRNVASARWQKAASSRVQVMCACHRSSTTRNGMATGFVPANCTTRYHWRRPAATTSSSRPVSEGCRRRAQ